MADAKAVLLSIEGVQQNDEGEEERISLMTVGEMTRTETGFCVVYEETSPESVISSRVKLDLTRDAVTMEREGDMVSSMVFMKNRHFTGEYQTPFGVLAMSVYALDVNVDVEESGGHVSLRYQLDLQGQFAAMHRLDMTIQPHGT